MIWKLIFDFLKESKSIPKRVSKQPIYISISSKMANVIKLSGRYDFLGIKNNVPAFIREEGKLDGLASDGPYILFFAGGWFITVRWHIESVE